MPNAVPHYRLTWGADDDTAGTLVFATMKEVEEHIRIWVGKDDEHDQYHADHIMGCLRGKAGSFAETNGTWITLELIGDAAALRAAHEGGMADAEAT
jgi:hypothetical protein